jgi:hypothetical protein
MVRTHTLGDAVTTKSDMAVVVSTSMLSEDELRGAFTALWTAVQSTPAQTASERAMQRFYAELAVHLRREHQRRRAALAEMQFDAESGDDDEGGLAADHEMPDGWVVDGPGDVPPPDCPPGVAG